MKEFVTLCDVQECAEKGRTMTLSSCETMELGGGGAMGEEEEEEESRSRLFWYAIVTSCLISINTLEQ